MGRPQSTATVREHSNSYDIFILVLTIMSLAIMVLLMLPLAPAELDALRFYDNLICVIFLVDFVVNLAGSHPRSEYLVGGGAGSTCWDRSRASGSPGRSASCACSGSSGSPASRGCCAASARRN